MYSEVFDISKNLREKRKERMTGKSKRDLTERKKHGCKGQEGDYKDRKEIIRTGREIKK